MEINGFLGTFEELKVVNRYVVIPEKPETYGKAKDHNRPFLVHNVLYKFSAL